jgi:hypothetical protein
MRTDRGALFTVLAVLALSLAAIATASRSAGAQQAAPQAEASPLVPGGPPLPNTPGWGLQVIATPYLWLAGTNTAIDTPLRRAPVVDSDVGAFEMLGHLDSVPIVGALEIRDGPLSLLGDVLHIPVSTTITTRNIFFTGGSAALSLNQGTALLLYHVLEQPVQSFDAGVGFRAWDFYSDLSLTGRGYYRSAYVSPSNAWADPLIGARFHRDFGDGLGLTAYGDIGGFGVGAHVDWQVIGTLDYQPKSWVTLRLGYRSLNFDYTETGGLGFDVHMKGPILAASFRF